MNRKTFVTFCCSEYLFYQNRRRGKSLFSGVGAGGRLNNLFKVVRCLSIKALNFSRQFGLPG